MMTIDDIKKRKKELGLTDRQLAEKSGVSLATVTNVLSKATENPRISTLLALETANPGMDPFDLRPGQRLVVPLPFPVVPTDVPWSASLAGYMADGLLRRYPARLRSRVLTHTAGVLPLFALTLGEGPRRVLYTAAHHASGSNQCSASAAQRNSAQSQSRCRLCARSWARTRRRGT